MYGRVYASILQKACSNRLRVYSTVQFQVILLCFSTSIKIQHHFSCSLFPPSLFQAAHHCRLSSWRPSGSSHRCCAGEESGSWFQSGRHYATRQDLDFQQGQVQINSILRSSEQVMDLSEPLFQLTVTKLLFNCKTYSNRSSSSNRG